MLRMHGPSEQCHMRKRGLSVGSENSGDRLTLWHQMNAQENVHRFSTAGFHPLEEGRHGSFVKALGKEHLKEREGMP